ncbi:type II toxin-antitoxin system Phd/YefM family antitoxin [Streptosporangium sp. NPDC004379]|uniref:type II toxin-antitoxin system Phd/YefM family antitoxin n=1 Tax=Streptosporangium sp. NPDC004379 TaxID=3366189 RepID=UPI0036C895DE
MSEPRPADHPVEAGDLIQGAGRLLARVKAGEALTIIDHGEPIAVILPLAGVKAAVPAVGYVSSGDPAWASHADEEPQG